jgi:hypothetical protein
MTESKALDILFRIMREELPLMTNSKCHKVAKKALGILKMYNVITLEKEPENVSESTQLPKKSKDW